MLALVLVVLALVLVVVLALVVSVSFHGVCVDDQFLVHLSPFGTEHVHQLTQVRPPPHPLSLYSTSRPSRPTAPTRAATVYTHLYTHRLHTYPTAVTYTLLS